MQGFEEASAFARGQKNPRVTHIRIEYSESTDTVVNTNSAGKEKTRFHTLGRNQAENLI